MAKQPEPHEHTGAEVLMCQYCGWTPCFSELVTVWAKGDTVDCHADDCGKTFKFRVDTTIEYTTERMPDHEHTNDR